MIVMNAHAELLNFFANISDEEEDEAKGHGKNFA